MIKGKYFKCIRSSFRQSETWFSAASSYLMFEHASAVLREELWAQIRVNTILCLCKLCSEVISKPDTLN